MPNVIDGTNGPDVLIGTPGDDIVTGGRGDDVAFMGGGDDVFVWRPGDGSDVVEGQAGSDTLEFIGSNAGEAIDISANGGRVRFFRNVAAVTMDLNGVERVHFSALGGQDTITVNDLSGTDVQQVDIDLAGTPGGATGDSQADAIILNGTNGADTVTLTGSATAVTATGLPATATVVNADAGADRLLIQTLAGNDHIDASAMQAGIALTLDGGTGDDTIIGGNGDDVLLGGADDDTVTGGRGNDVAFLGAGNDVFVWVPGDGSDVVEGQAGSDTLDFLGSNASEIIDIAANGSRARFFRDVANVTMDLNGVERVHFSALGGADTITVNDLSGTGMQQVDIDLAATAGGATGDSQADQVSVNGTTGSDTIALTQAAGVVTVSGLAAGIAIDHADAGVDRLVLNAGVGSDVIDASGITVPGLALTLNGGDGEDIILGSAGDDLVAGGRGDDVALLGAGDDVFTWVPGDGSDVVEGQAGFDTLDFLGSNASEIIDISANGDRVRFHRDVANVTMDLNGVERIQFSAVGGNDLIDASVAPVGIALTLDGGTGADTLIVGSGTLSADDRLDGGADFDTLVLRGPGLFDLRAPATLTGIESITAREGQAAFAAGGRTFPAQNQLVLLRDGLDATVNVSPALLNPANPKPATITIVGAHNAAVINLGSGNDTVIVGDARETVRGGSGDNTIQVNSGTIGATIDGGTGSSRLVVTGGGEVAMSGNITRIPAVFLAPSAGNYDFTANGTVGLQVTDLSGGADTLRAGGFGQTLTGGGGNDRMVGFSGGGTTFLNSAEAFNNDTISGLLSSDAIRVTDMGFSGLVASFTDNGSNTAGVLSLADGVRSTSLTIEGSHRLSDFQFSAFGTNGTSIVLQS